MLSRQEVLDLQAECFADDIPIPPGAASWGEERLRAYFESGGAEESVCGDLDSARSSVDAATLRDDPGDGDDGPALAIDGDDAESGFFECCVGGEPDLEVLRFLRLSALAGGDAFLLEPIFANELWDFLAAPISPDNERAALEAVRAEADALQRTLLDAGPAAGDARFEALRRTELDALDATLNWVAADLSMLAGKEYYQEKRLKSLGLDTEWSEDEGNQWTGARGTAW